MKTSNPFKKIVLKVGSVDLSRWAVVSCLVLWVGTAFSIALMEIAFVAGLVCWIGWHIQLKTQKGAGAFSLKAEEGVGFRFDWALWTPLALFVVSVLISFFVSEYPKQSFRGLYKIVKPLLAFFMIAELFKDPKSQKRFDAVFLMVFSIMTIDCSIQYVFGRDLIRFCPAQTSSAGLRLPGPFGAFSKLAAFLILAIPVFAMQFWSRFTQPEYRKKSFYPLALGVAGLLLLYFTRSRGPVVALALSFGALCMYKRWFKLLGIAFLLALAMLVITPRDVLIHRDAEGKEQSIVERFVLWKRALHVIEAKPLTGTGINTYNAAHAKYDKEQNWRVRGYYAHNGYLQLAAEIGIPGIVCFLGFLVMFFRRFLQSVGRVRGTSEEYVQLGFLTGLLAFLLYATSDTNLQSPPSIMSFWFLAGILLARQRMVLR